MLISTDRFARADDSTTAPCPDGFQGLCGGSWKGIENHLDYIQGMEFDAIWISPITKQIDDPARSYHGYSQMDLYQLNSEFGTAQDLEDLSAALHARGMYLMVDVVTNHFGWNGDISTIDYSQLNPFNSADSYHPFCEIEDGNNMTQSPSATFFFMFRRSQRSTPPNRPSAPNTAPGSSN